jgi:hypothetical protein
MSGLAQQKLRVPHLDSIGALGIECAVVGCGKRDSLQGLAFNRAINDQEALGLVGLV